MFKGTLKTNGEVFLGTRDFQGALTICQGIFGNDTIHGIVKCDDSEADGKNVFRLASLPKKQVAKTS